MGFKIYQVDAFTEIPFKGNPAAVCFLEEEKDDQWMAAVAKENNLSETAFLQKQSDGFNLRWFTPEVEVDLCGHATLASAHILWETKQLQISQPSIFHTKSGILTAFKKENLIEMNFPLTPVEPAAPPDRLVEALGIRPIFVGKSKFDYLLEVEDDEIVYRLKPDFALLKTLACRGIMVTSKSEDSKYDFLSRFFAPAVGIDEDPVTGSAHCSLGSYWQKKLDKKEFSAYQASPRGGHLQLRIDDDRIWIGGNAVTIFTGELMV